VEDGIKRLACSLYAQVRIEEQYLRWHAISRIRERPGSGFA